MHSFQLQDSKQFFPFTLEAIALYICLVLALANSVSLTLSVLFYRIEHESGIFRIYFCLWVKLKWYIVVRTEQTTFGCECAKCQPYISWIC